jgi:type I restriction enzyme S subunit
MCSDTLDQQEVPIGVYVVRSQYGLNSVSTRDGNVPIIGMKDMTAGKITTEAWARTHVDENELPEYLLQKGDILLNRTNSADLVGKVSLWDREEEAVFASYLVRFQFDTARALPEFVNHYLNWDDSQQRLKQVSTRGVSQANINPTTFRNYFMVSWPSLPVQRRIAAVLDEWDRAIATAEKLLDSKKKRQIAVLATVFANAPKRPLYELADVIMGQSPPSSAYREPSTGHLPLVQGAADFSGGLVVAQSDTDIVTKSVDQPCIVMSVRAPVGTIARLSFPACLGRGVCAIIPKDDLGLDYIASVLTGLSSYWATMAQGSSFEAVSGEVIREALVPVGTPDFMRSAALVFQLVTQELNQELDRSRALRLQKRGLMQKLLSCEWPVPASIDRLLPGGQDIDEAVGAEVRRAEATG